MGWLLGVYAVGVFLILIALFVGWSDRRARKQREKHAH